MDRDILPLSACLFQLCLLFRQVLWSLEFFEPVPTSHAVPLNEWAKQHPGRFYSSTVTTMTCSFKQCSLPVYIEHHLHRGWQFSLPNLWDLRPYGLLDSFSTVPAIPSYQIFIKPAPWARPCVRCQRYTAKEGLWFLPKIFYSSEKCNPSGNIYYRYKKNALKMQITERIKLLGKE